MISRTALKRKSRDQLSRTVRLRQYLQRRQYSEALKLAAYMEETAEELRTLRWQRDEIV